MSRRLGVLLALVGVIIVVLGLVFTALLFRQATAPTAPATALPPVTVPVVVSTHALTIRSLVQAADVQIVQMPAEFVPLDALSSVQDAVGKITMIPLSTGELVLHHHLADPTNISQDMSFIIGDDQVVMAFPATDLMSQVNVLQPGDQVDILVSVEEPVQPTTGGGAVSGGSSTSSQQDKQLFTFDALQRLTIQAMVVEIKPKTQSSSSTSSTAAGSVEGEPPPTPTPSLDEIQPLAVMLALSPQDALVLKNLKDAGGTVDIVLRTPTSSQAFDAQPVSPEYLKDRYGLVVEGPNPLIGPTPTP